MAEDRKIYKLGEDIDRSRAEIAALQKRVQQIISKREATAKKRGQKADR